MRWLPGSLFGRNLLLIVGLIVAGQLSSAILFRFAVQEPRISHIASMVALQIEATEATLADLTPERRAELLQRLARPPLMAVSPGAPPEGATPSSRNALIRSFIEHLHASLGTPHQIRWEAAPERRIWVQLSGPGDIWIGFTTDRIALEYSLHWLGVSIASGLLALFGAWWIQRRLNEPLSRLVEAARSIGRGQTMAPLPETGPREIAEVSRSFNRMSESLAREERDRNFLLGAVSHDLRTPLAKMRLALEIISSQPDPELVVAMQRHIETIDAMLAQFLDYVRGADTEAAVVMDAATLVHQLAAEHSVAAVSWRVDSVDSAPIRARPSAFSRAVVNLMENAVRYGRPEFIIRVHQEVGLVVISVIDHGAGIDSARLEEARRPFVRLADPERSAAGTGLGLAIVERIAAAHGGHLALGPAEKSGFAARLILPAASR